MWEELSSSQIATPSTIFFADWLEQYVLVPVYERKAREVFGVAQQIDPFFSKLQTTPQTPPYHAEGPFVADGVERGLAGLYAVQDGASLMQIEEFHRDKTLHEEVQELEHVLTEQVASLTVYMLVHDLGKPKTLVLDAPQGSRGEQEGFHQHNYRSSKTANDVDRDLYGKLFRAFQASLDEKTPTDVTAGFFDHYEIHAHYPGHEKHALSDHEQTFDLLCDQFRLRPRDRDLVRFAVRNHMQAIGRFEQTIDVHTYELLVSRAHKAGLDGDDAMDFLLACLFLDACVGSLSYVDGEFRAQTDMVLRFLRTEEAVAPHRRAQRRARQQEREEARLRYALKEAKLDGDTLFALLQTPFGPERGRIADEIRSYVLNSTQPVTIATHTHEIEKRVQKARALFDAGQKA